MIPIFVVNLKKDIQKKKDMQRISKKHNLEIEYIEAIYGEELPQSEIDKVYSERRAIQKFGRGLSRGEIGCALSHISIFKKMTENNIQRAIVLEDDVLLCNNFSKILLKLLDMQIEYDMVLFGYDADIKRDVFLYTSLWGNKKLLKEYKLKRLIKVGLGTYGYMITLHGAQKLSQKIKFVDMPIDHYAGDVKNLNLYGLSPRCVTVSEYNLFNSSIVKERDELKKFLVSSKYNNLFTRLLNRIRLGIRLIILKILPLTLSQRYATVIFRNKRKDNITK